MGILKRFVLLHLLYALAIGRQLCWAPKAAPHKFDDPAFKVGSPLSVSRRQKKASVFILFLICSLIHFAGNAAAISLKNIDVGVFRFRLEVRAENEVDDARLSLSFLDFAELDEIVVFDGLTITDAGETYVATMADQNFPAAAFLLTNGVSDWIKVLVAQSPRAVNIKGTEPLLLFGDYTGTSGIDFAGLIVASIDLLITDTGFEYGFDPGQGSFTDITVEGEVTINTGPISTAVFAEAYGSSNIDYNYSIFSDADGDGDVDGFDLSIFAKHHAAFGGSGW